jgi:cytochrome c biogenesis protein CcmG/thiol:disulfide interchange protein DsbE
MARSHFYVLTVFAVVLVGCRASYRDAPDIELLSLTGDDFSLRAHRGEVVLLNFWATWCGPCVAEIPELERVHRDYAGRGLTVVGVSIDDDGFESVRPFLAERNVTYKIVHDPGDAQSALGELLAVPTTVLIDRRSRIREIIVGAFAANKLRTSLESMLRE